MINRTKRGRQELVYVCKTRKQALARKAPVYESGIPCRHLHNTWRRTDDDACLGCLSARRDVFVGLAVDYRDEAVVRRYAKRIMDSLLLQEGEMPHPLTTLSGITIGFHSTYTKRI